MKTILLIFLFQSITFGIYAQIFIPISIPYESSFRPADFPKTNSEVLFDPSFPFLGYNDSIFKENTIDQWLISLPLISDSLLNQCIKTTMLSYGFEAKYLNPKKGAEIWYGVIKWELPVLVGTYYKNTFDSTYLYVLSGFYLNGFNKKTKTNFSQSICDRLDFILQRTLKMKQ